MKNKSGMSVMLIAFISIAGVLVTLIGALIFALVNKVDVTPLFTNITSFWNTIKWWLLGLVIFVFLWMIGAFKLIKTRVLRV